MRFRFWCRSPKITDIAQLPESIYTEFRDAMANKKPGKAKHQAQLLLKHINKNSVDAKEQRAMEIAQNFIDFYTICELYRIPLVINNYVEQRGGSIPRWENLDPIIFLGPI